jgi:hypothetical protein
MGNYKLKRSYPIADSAIIFLVFDGEGVLASKLHQVFANPFLHLPNEEVHLMETLAGELYLTQQFAFGLVDVLLIRRRIGVGQWLGGD